jgi:hypothetical protein
MEALQHTADRTNPRYQLTGGIWANEFQLASKQKLAFEFRE